jgi:hypothetical protein
MRNLPETPIIFLVYSPKSYFLAFWGPFLWQLAKLIVQSNALTGIPATHTRSWAQTEAYGMRVVTQDFGRKSKLNFLVLTQVVRMSSRS